MAGATAGVLDGIWTAAFLPGTRSGVGPSVWTLTLKGIWTSCWLLVEVVLTVTGSVCGIGTVWALTYAVGGCEAFGI